MNSGLKLTALYAYGCRKTRELGIDEKLKKFVLFKENEKEIESEVKKLEPFFYYQLIAKANGIDNPFDKQVVKAYWLGNQLLEKVKPEILKELVGKVDSSYLIRANYLILGGKAHHNFSVLSKVAIRNEKILEIVNTCLISWGEVKKILKDELIISYQPLVLRNKKIIFSEREERKIGCSLLKKVSLNDIISIHFNEAREVLKPDDLEQLRKYTQEAIEFFN
ncbi:MAG: DUF6390 family protein [Patescibacteria group bacterium]